MKFTITPQRNVLGTDVTLRIEAEGDETIAGVVVECDGTTASDETLSPPEVTYEQQISSAVGYTPGSQHVIRVTATISNGVEKVASSRWTDR